MKRSQIKKIKAKGAWGHKVNRFFCEKCSTASPRTEAMEIHYDKTGHKWSSLAGHNKFHKDNKQ